MLRDKSSILSPRILAFIAASSLGLELWLGFIWIPRVSVVAVVLLEL